MSFQVGKGIDWLLTSDGSVLSKIKVWLSCPIWIPWVAYQVVKAAIQGDK